MKTIVSGIPCFLLVIGGCFPVRADVRRQIGPRDCVQVHYLLQDDSLRSPIQINDQGSRVAYLVKSPNIATNENDIDLFGAELIKQNVSSPKLLVHGTGISQIKWLEDGNRIAYLIKRSGRVVVESLDIRTHRLAMLARAQGDITEYSISRDASVIAVAANAPTDEQGQISRSADEIANGYRIPFETEYVFAHPEKMLYVIRRDGQGRYEQPRQLFVSSPFTGKPIDKLFCVLNLRLSLSPDGRRLAVTYLEHGDDVPSDWRGSSHVRGIIERVNEVQITVTVDLATGKTAVPFKTPWPYSVPVWSKDSHQFIEIAEPPFGSRWDPVKQQEWSSRIQMFSVDVTTGNVQLVREHVSDVGSQPRWRSNGDLILADNENLVHRLSDRDGEWKELSQFHIGFQDGCHVTVIASDGEYVIGECQGATMPPELFTYTAKQEQPHIFARLNPQFDMLSLAPSREIRWKLPTGYEASGLLLMPIDYRKGVRYPLVVQTYPVYQGGFLCDSGESHDPASPPQPLANGGVMYLIRSRQNGENDGEHYPKGYPGGIGEAAFQMDLADGAVKELINEGLVDPTRVGIIGFSRSGWYTDFTLVNSNLRYRAATIADGSQFTLGDYWLFHSERTLGPYDDIYGGPPYGPTLKNWLKYSVSFNMDKIHTPLLIETMGYGIPYSNLNTPPLTLAAFFEQFTGLSRLHVPVELYYYPNEEHQPDHPEARLSSLQRNVDWFRFWLQGYERPDPEDPDQYERWKHLRDVQDKDASSSRPAEEIVTP